MHLRKARFVRSALVAATVVVLGATACTAPPADEPVRSPSPQEPPLEVREPESHTLVLDSSDPAELALTASQVLFERSELVVVAAAGDEEALPTASAAAAALHAPALLAGGGISDEALSSELERLGVATAVVVEPTTGLDDVEHVEPSASPEEAPGPAGSAAVRAGVDVVRLDVGLATDEGELAEDDLEALRETLPTTGEPVLLSEVLALTDPQPGQEAAIATVRAAGAVTFEVPGGDPAAVPEAIAMIDDAQALTVVGVGPTFGDPEIFAWKVLTAEHGVLLPTGTQHLFPARYVTTSADRSDDPATVVARATEDAAEYAVEGEPVVPTVVVRASTPSGSAGADGDYVTEEAIEEIEPIVRAARDAGQYVLLDVAAGPGPVVEEVRDLEPLLTIPGVGVALRPEQRRGDGVDTRSYLMEAAEIAEVVAYLAEVTTREGLPPTLLVVHQTRPDSVPDRTALRALPQVEIVITADRTGGATTGEWVWNQLTEELPPDVRLGWSGPQRVHAGAARLVPTEPAVPVLVAAS